MTNYITCFLSTVNAYYSICTCILHEFSVLFREHFPRNSDNKCILYLYVDSDVTAVKLPSTAMSYHYGSENTLGRIQGGGGGPGVQGPPPLVPREGVLDPSSKMKKTAFIV